MSKTYIGELLVNEGLITPQQLKESLVKQKDFPQVMLGDVMVLMGYLTAEQLKYTLKKQNEAVSGIKKKCANSDISYTNVEKLAKIQDGLLQLLIKKNIISKEELLEVINR